MLPGVRRVNDDTAKFIFTLLIASYSRVLLLTSVILLILSCLGRKCIPSLQAYKVSLFCLHFLVSSFSKPIICAVVCVCDSYDAAATVDNQAAAVDLLRGRFWFCFKVGLLNMLCKKVGSDGWWFVLSFNVFGRFVC
uniref:Uncharacterized protein n=1 Tax=Chaetoceros debilis TaxID=122233 RepID=A0A7S3QHF8_9STRA